MSPQEIWKEQQLKIKQKYDQIKILAISEVEADLKELRRMLYVGAEAGRKGATEKVQQWHKATCRRGGKFKEEDFNLDLVSPFYETVKAAWIALFADFKDSLNRIITNMKDFIDAMFVDAIQQMVCDGESHQSV
ncbi:hypothetical protein HDV00_012590 [Rhizophlyctis rosea]|nr:hypothetical protein HDV00_012590 [Rhizophlyctis rosea]